MSGEPRGLPLTFIRDHVIPLVYVGEITHNNRRNTAPRLPERNDWYCDLMGDNQFFEMLKRDWNLVAKIDTPQLTPSVNDAMYNFERRSRVEKLVERNRARVAEREERAERAKRAEGNR